MPTSMHNRCMELDWTRLAGAIREAREAAGLSQVALAERAGISEGSVQNLEDASRRPSRIPPSLAKVEKALNWATGSAIAILQGASGPVTIRDEGDGLYVAKIPEDELHEAISMSAIAVSDNLTAREIRDLSRRVVEELKARGHL